MNFRRSSYNPREWLMTKDQHGLYLRLWGKACIAQGWTTAKGLTSIQIDAKRKEQHAIVFGSPISAKQINPRGMFDDIKAHFLMLTDNIKGTIETDHAEIGEARRLRKLIEEHLKCLALYHPDPEAYLTAILLDKFRGVTDLDSLSAKRSYLERPSQLEQVVWTLNRCINGKEGLRNQAGHSLHDMRTRAGLECDCTLCINRRKFNAQPVPSFVPGDADESTVTVPVEQSEGEPF